MMDTEERQHAVQQVKAHILSHNKAILTKATQTSASTCRGPKTESTRSQMFFRARSSKQGRRAEQDVSGRHREHDSGQERSSSA